MLTVNELIDDVFEKEGGFVNDPDDPGGATNFGITRATLAAYLRRPVTVQEVRNLSKQEARDIYAKKYYIEPRINELPEILQPTVFDMYVNAGNKAIKILQKLLNEIGESVDVDGALGPQSIGAVDRVFGKAINEHGVPAAQLLVDAYGIARRDFYYAIGDSRKQSRKYAMTKAGGKGGWITRAEDFISERYHLTESEHKERVKAWA